MSRRKGRSALHQAMSCTVIVTPFTLDVGWSAR